MQQLKYYSHFVCKFSLNIIYKSYLMSYVLIVIMQLFCNEVII